MKIVRYKKNGNLETGVLEGEQIKVVAGEISGEYSFTGEIELLSEIELVAPCKPSKIVCVGLNYKDHAKELDMELPQRPIIFLKPASAVVGPNSAISYPAMSQQLDYEAELAVVIKDRIKDISSKEAKEHILGYTCFNDVTARDLQNEDGQWTRAKSFDTFAPLGPVIETDLEPSNLDIKSIHNGIIKQFSNTEQMIFSIPEIISFISKIMTLKAGDVIATGTPPGVGEMKPDGEIEVVIEGIGRLKNEI